VTIKVRIPTSASVERAMLEIFDYRNVGKFSNQYLYDMCISSRLVI
jgi:hypothetical protein